MNLKEQFIQKALIDFGLEVADNILWFIDERKVYYGKVQEGVIIDYTYGTMNDNIFVMEYTLSKDDIDIEGWKSFIEKYLEIPCSTELL